MLNRRHLRIKVLQVLYSYYQSEDKKIAPRQVELLRSLDHIYDLYLLLLLSFAEVKSIASHRIEEDKKKMLADENDLNPNLKLVENQIISILESNNSLNGASEKLKVNWIGDENQEMFRKIYFEIRESETYFEFMNNDRSGFDEDKAFAISLFKNDIANSELLYSHFEEKDIHWIDDIDLACSMVVKTLKGFEPDGKNEIFPLYKDKDDEVTFVRQLLEKTASMDLESEQLIDELTSNWELDRIAKMDVILMKMAITEMQVFDNIPTKVTLNEYIEISKYYSTPKSNGFINGVLDKAIDRLNAEGKIEKVGRGLIN